MIELKVEEYCHDCPEFEAKCDKDSFVFADGRVLHSNVIITCEHAGRCATIKKYLTNPDPKEKSETEVTPVKSGEFCTKCAYSYDRDICILACAGCRAHTIVTCEAYSYDHAKCGCLTLNYGDPCPYYKEAKDA